MNGMFQPMMQQPTSYSAQTRYYSPAASSGMTQSDINNMSYDQLVSAARTGRLNYNDPNAPQQPEMPMYQPQPMPYFPMEMSGTAYPQFNLGYNPYMGMFSNMGNYDQFGNFNMMPQQGMFNFGLPAFGYGSNF